MGFSQELQDFSEGFGSGFQMAESGSDRATKKLQRKKLEFETSPQYQEQELEQRGATIEATKGETALRGEQTEELKYKNSPASRAAQEAALQAETKYNNALADKTAADADAARYANTPKQREAAARKDAADAAFVEANAAKVAADADAQQYLNEPPQRERAAKATEAATADVEATTGERGAVTHKTEAEARKIELENQQTENFMKILEGKTRDVEGRAGLPEVYDPNQAVETDDTPDPDAEEAPGPTSAVEVPEVSTATHDDDSSTGYEGFEEERGDTISPKTTRKLVDARLTRGGDALAAEDVALRPPPGGRPEVVEAARPFKVDLGGGKVWTEAEEQAVPTETTPVTSEGKPRVKNKSLAAEQAGPRAHPHVDEQQNRMAATRKKPLDPATVNVLEYAGANTGINAVVYSGGQAGKGEEGPRTGSTRHDHGLAADVKLYDSKTGRLLDMRNPEDAERMRDFGMYAVQAGATGIGAGEGYMGNSSMHIGFGKEASWGGAPWIQDALAQGKATRDKMTGMPGGSDVTKMFQDGSIHQSARNAALAGMKYAVGSHGLDQDSAVNTPENDDAAYSFMSGDFGADAEQVEEVENVVQNIAKEAGFVINETEKPMYALAAVYEAYLAVGKPDEAEKAAGALYGHYKKLFGQYGAVAKAAASQGDMDAAVEAAARAYANVPDGYDVQFNQLDDGRYEVVMTNQETKEVTHRQIATPQEIGGMIMEINPGHFDQFMASAAGAQEREGTLSEAFVAQHPEKAGMTLGEAKESRLIGGGVDEDTGISTGGGKGKDTDTGIIKVDTPEKRQQVADQVKDSLTKFVGNITETGTTDEVDVSRLGPETNSDMLMYIRPVMEKVAIQNYDKVPPDLVVEAIVNMSEQAPTAAKILPDDQTIEITVEGSPPIKMQKELYYRLADARSRYGGTAQAESDQKLGELRRTTAPGILPDYDPTRYPVGERVGGEAVPVAAAPAEPLTTRTGRAATPLLPGGPQKSTLPSRANMPRNPVRPRSRSDYLPR